MVTRFLMVQNIFLQQFSKIIQYLYQLKNLLNILVEYFIRMNSSKSNGMSEENIEKVTKSDSLFSPTFVDHHVLPDINFNGRHLIKNNISIAKEAINIFISQLVNQWTRDLNTDCTIGSCLLVSVKLTKTKNVNLDKYKYSGYSIGFDSRSKFSFKYGNLGKTRLFLEMI